MIKKLPIFILGILGILFMSSCDTVKIAVSDPLAEEEILTYIQDEIYRETGDTVTITITEKDKLKPGIPSLFGTPTNYEFIADGYSYNIEIVNKENAQLTATGIYEDGHVIYDTNLADGKKFVKASLTHDYRKQKGLFLAKQEMLEVLEENFSDYYFYKDVSNDTGYDIFLHSSDYEAICDLLSCFRDIVLNYRNDAYISYSVYIYKDEAVFHNTDFESYKNGKESYSGQSYGAHMIEQYTGKTATRIGFGKGFDYNLFTSNGASAAETYDEYVDYKSFDYLVFWYKAEPNSFGGSNHPQMQIFGVK